MSVNVHPFRQGEATSDDAVLERLGIRGREAMELAALKLPILPGFVIDADAVTTLGKSPLRDTIVDQFQTIEPITGKEFGSEEGPMLVKIVISPNLVIAQYPFLHNFGLTDATLGGLHLPGDTAPPLVVLHLLPSGASVTTGMPVGIGRHGLASTLTTFARLGCGSVLIDYRGVGDSDGPRDPAGLLADGQAMWRKAVELADGQADRVVIRAASIGTVIAADLLASGHRPAAAVLIAPVRASTITYHGARAQYGCPRAAGGNAVVATCARSPGNSACSVKAAVAVAPNRSLSCTTIG